MNFDFVPFYISQHRAQQRDSINTIIDFDSIAVLDDGKIAEFGPAADLLENKEGLFHKLVKSTGKESYEELSAKARAARKKRS